MTDYPDKQESTAALETMYTALLEGSLVLSKHGGWVHNGVPFSNLKLAELFHRSVTWDKGRSCFVIRLGAQQATFTCEDAPYFVVRVDAAASPWTLYLAGGAQVPFLPETLAIGAENQFYCSVYGEHQARFARSAHQTLLEHAVDEQTLRIDGKNITPRTGSAQ